MSRGHGREAQHRGRAGCSSPEEQHPAASAPLNSSSPTAGSTWNCFSFWCDKQNAKDVVKPTWEFCCFTGWTGSDYEH